MSPRGVIILEGVCGAGKTTLAAALAEEARAAGGTATIIPQSVTYGPVAPYEDAGTLDDALSLRLLEDVCARIESQAASASDGGIVIVDTLHITQFVRPGVLSPASFQRVDSRLHTTLNPLVVFLMAGKDTIRARAIEERRRTYPSFLRYARKFGSTDDALVAHFADEQDRMQALLETGCRLKHIQLPAGDDPQRLARRVVSGSPTA